jgi:RNA polymerase sigma factor (sigma-70 family)
MDDDATLLRRYAHTRDEAVFAALVHHHVNFVHSVAGRCVRGDADLARDVSQQVFLALARRAAALVGHPCLLGWLHTCACQRAADLVRSEARRRLRETTATTDPALAAEPPVPWENVAPVLDLALQTLGARDRETVLLRYFAQKPFADIAVALDTTEAAAQMRATRALGKLRRALAARGVTSTASALGLALGANAVSAAPASVAATTLAALATSNAVVGTASATHVAFTLFTAMTTSTKASLAAAALTLLILGCAIGSRLAHRPQPATASATAKPTNDFASATVLIEQQRRRIVDLEQRLAEAETLEVSIPLTADEVASLAGDIRRRTLLFKEAYPSVPHDTDPEYDRYLFTLRELLVDSVPLQAQAILAQRQIGTASGAANFQAVYLKNALKLDDIQSSEVHRLLLAGYTTFFERNNPSAGRPQENADVWLKGRRTLNREITAAVAALLSPMQQVYFKQIAGDYLMFYTNFSYPSGVEY